LADDDSKDIDMPILMLDAGSDPDRTELMKHMKSKPCGDECHTERYESMEHGWTIRGDKNDVETKKCADDAYEKVEKYLNKYLL